MLPRLRGCSNDAPFARNLNPDFESLLNNEVLYRTGTDEVRLRIAEKLFVVAGMTRPTGCHPAMCCPSWEKGICNIVIETRAGDREWESMLGQMVRSIRVEIPAISALGESMLYKRKGHNARWSFAVMQE